MSTPSYQLLPLATSQLVGDNREFDASGIEDPSLSVHSYQLLPLATSQLMGDNREFDASGIFWGFLLIVGGGELISI